MASARPAGTSPVARNPFERLVRFSADELADIHEATAERCAFKSANADRITNRRISDNSDYEISYIGILGETAVSRLIGVPVDTGVYLKGGAFDFSLYGVSIEVKTGRGHLVFNALPTADIAVLVYYDGFPPENAWVQGWITRQEFGEVHFKHDFGYGERLALAPAQLLPIDSLRAYCLSLRNMRWLLERYKGLESGRSNGEGPGKVLV